MNRNRILAKLLLIDFILFFLFLLAARRLMAWWEERREPAGTVWETAKIMEETERDGPSKGEYAKITEKEEVTEKKRVALTYDDGPSKRWTGALLDVLKEKGVSASFFLLGEKIEGNEELICRIQEEGHLIGNHTYHHVQITTLSDQEACQEINETSRLVEEITGAKVEYVRPPFGQWNRELECGINMIPVFWDVDTLDWLTRNKKQIVNKVVTNVGENDIILMHDSYETTVEATEEIIDLLRKENFEFVTVDEILMD